MRRWSHCWGRVAKSWSHLNWIYLFSRNYPWSPPSGNCPLAGSNSSCWPSHTPVWTSTSWLRCSANAEIIGDETWSRTVSKYSWINTAHRLHCRCPPTTLKKTSSGCAQRRSRPLPTEAVAIDAWSSPVCHDFKRSKFDPRPTTYGSTWGCFSATRQR